MSSSAAGVLDGEIDKEKTCVSERDEAIAALIRQLREKDALIAEKDALIAEKDAMLAEEKDEIKSLPSHCGEDDEFTHHAHGLGFEVAGSVRNGTVATFDDYLHAQKKLRSKSHRSQKWKSSTLSTNDGGGETAGEMPNDGGGGMVRTAEEMRVIRESILGRRGAVVQWDNINIDVCQLDGDETDDHHHNGNIAWYLPPVQRQRWCDDQTLPHVNWGDLFFDLFYVAAAYNLGVLVLAATEGNGGSEIILRVFLYFFGSLGPLWTCWEAQTFYASRYVTNDYFHRLVEIIRYVCVGAAIFNIKFVSFSNPASVSVMMFTLTMLLELIMSMGLGLELYYKAIGDKRSIKNHTLDDFRFGNGALFALYLAAFIIAAVQYVQSSKGQEGGLHPSVDDSAVTTYENETNDGKEHRVLGGTSHEEAYSADRSKWDLHDLPLTLTAAAFFLRLILSSIWFHYRGRRGDVRDWYVPANIDYLIHRYGEFVMLMIGEGVLSLLIVHTVETREYDVVVFCGIVTIIFLFVLKTESEPSDPSTHALWRSSVAVISYRFFTQSLTICLIGFGVSYKSFLHEIYREDIEHKKVDYLLESKVFSGFLTGVILSLELMNTSHYGLKKSIGFLFQADDEGKKKLNFPVAIIAVVKVGIIFFCVTLFTRTNEPDTLAVRGLLIVVALSVTRVLNTIFIHETE